MTIEISTRRRATGVLCAFTLTFVVSLGVRLYLDRQASDTPTFELHEATSADLCRADRIAISPNGNFAVLTSTKQNRNTLVDEGIRLGIVDLRCAFENETSQSCAIGMEALDDLRALGWSPDGASLYAIENRSTLVQISPKVTGQLKRDVPISRIAVSKRLADSLILLGPAGSNDLKTEAASLGKRMDAAESGLPKGLEVVGVFLTANEQIGLIASGADDLELFFGGARYGFNPAGVKFFEASQARLTRKFDADKGDLYLSDAGLSQRYFWPVVTPAGAGPFVRPIISPNDGSIQGEMGRKGISLISRNIQAKQLEKAVNDSISERKSLVLQDFSLSNNTFAYVMTGALGESEFIFQSGSRHFSLVCKQRHLSEYVVDSYEPVDLGKSGWPLYGIKITVADSVGTVLFYGGGPSSGNVMDLGQHPSIRNYLQRGWNVLFVNYSGSTATGLDVSSRLVKRGVKSLTKDAEVVAEYLAREPQRGKLIVHGESFGALGAVALDGLLNGPRGLVLVAPFLKHKAPEILTPQRATPFSKVSVSAQKRFERYALGVDDSNFNEFQADIDAILSARSPDTPTLIAFGSADPVSTVGDMPTIWNQNIRTVDIPSGHETISVMPQVWAAFDNWIAETAK